MDENKLNETGNSVVAREMGLTTEAVRRKVLKIRRSIAVVPYVSPPRSTRDERLLERRASHRGDDGEV